MFFLFVYSQSQVPSIVFFFATMLIYNLLFLQIVVAMQSLFTKTKNKNSSFISIILEDYKIFKVFFHYKNKIITQQQDQIK